MSRMSPVLWRRVCDVDVSFRVAHSVVLLALNLQIRACVSFGTHTELRKESGFQARGDRTQWYKG